MAFHEFTCTALVAPHWERRFAELESDTPLAPRTLAPIVVAIAASRPPASVAVALAQRALEDGRLDAPKTGRDRQRVSSTAGALSQAARVYHDSITAATRRGNRLTVAWQSTMRSKASLRLGEIRRAEAEGRLALGTSKEGSGGARRRVVRLAPARRTPRARGCRRGHRARQQRPRAGERRAPRFRTRSCAARLRTSTSRSAGRTPPFGRPEPPVASYPRRSRTPTAAIGAPPPRSRSRRCSGRGWCARWPRRSSSTRAASACREAEGAALRTLGLVIGGADWIGALRQSVEVLEHAEGRLEHAPSPP